MTHIVVRLIKKRCLRTSFSSMSSSFRITIACKKTNGKIKCKKKTIKVNDELHLHYNKSNLKGGSKVWNTKFWRERYKENRRAVLIKILRHLNISVWSHPTLPLKHWVITPRKHNLSESSHIAQWEYETTFVCLKDKYNILAHARLILYVSKGLFSYSTNERTWSSDYLHSKMIHKWNGTQWIPTT